MTRYTLSISVLVAVLLLYGLVVPSDAEQPIDDIWAIQQQGKVISATLGRSTTATLRTRLARPENEEKSQPTVALHWKAPKDDTQWYTIRYGVKPELLDTKIKVATSSLETILDPVHGKLFKYSLLPKSSTKFVYYSLQSEGPLGVSPATPIQRVVVESSSN